MKKGLILLSIVILLVTVAGTVWAKPEITEDGHFDTTVTMKEKILDNNPNVTEESFTDKYITTGNGKVVIVDPLEVFAD